ncbi:MAG: hypothetical protein M1825_001511 [Sarcosagium campestre]|nr:MAG: hypothetical protein M1825_001511 [Sarcosagium campestre]
MPIDHSAIRVPASKFDETVTFYLKALAPLGYVEIMRPFPQLVGLGAGGKPDFWIGVTDGETVAPAVHFAFTAQDRGAVDAWHAEALKSGGTCNGKPGVRAHYHPHYYGAYVFDPVGNNVEAVSHGPAAAAAASDADTKE